MPRKITRAAAGWNLLFGPPGTPFPGWHGRGSVQARAATKSNLGINPVAEWLFEGSTVVSLRTCNVRGDGFAETDNLGNILTEQEQLSYASAGSIDFNGSGLGHVRADVTIPVWYAFEFWFRDNYIERNAISRRPMVGQNNNAHDNVGHYNNASFSYNHNFPTAINSFNGDQKWEIEIDFAGFPRGSGGTGKLHCLMVFHDTGATTNYVVCMDGMPVGSGTNSGNLASRLPAFNGQSAAVDGFAGVFGSASYYNNGANLTLADIRNLFETSSLDKNADMLTWPRWFQLDASNVTVDQRRDKQALLGDVLDATGIRSGAIQRLDESGDRRNTYFELEIMDQGDTNQATLVGLRKLAESGAVGTVSENPEDCVYLKAGKLYDGANVALPTGSGEDEQDGSTLANPTTGQVFQFAIAWDEFNPQQFWIGDGTQWKGRVGSPDPETLTDGIGFMDTAYNWAAWLRTNGSDGNGLVRLRALKGEFRYPIPAGFVAWEEDGLEVEDEPSGVNRREAALRFNQSELKSANGAEYKFEGNTQALVARNIGYSPERYASANMQFTLTFVNSRYNQAQMSHASPVSYGMTRDAVAYMEEQGGTIHPGMHSYELWFKQPNLQPINSALFGAPGNRWVFVGVQPLRNYPVLENAFNANVGWESTIKMPYGDNKPHQLMECHETGMTSSGSVGVVYWDGIPIVAFSNGGWSWSSNVNRSGFEFNPDANTGDSSRAGADYGYFRTINGGDFLKMVDVRRLYEASALRVTIDQPAGMESGDILDAQLTDSVHITTYAADGARLNYTVGETTTPGWLALGVIGDYMTIDMLVETTVVAFKMQGLHNTSQWILTFDLETAGDDQVYSVHQAGIPTNIIAVNAIEDVVFDTPATARYFRIVVQTWSVNIGLRMEVITQQPDPHLDPVGLESGAILDGQMTATSDFGAGFEAFEARLNGASAWIPAAPSLGEYHQVDFIARRRIFQVSSQAHSGFAGYTTSYRLEYSDDGVTYTQYNNNQTLIANVDTTTIVTNDLIPFIARFVRLYPVTWSGTHSLRLEYVTGQIYETDIANLPRWLELDSVNCTVNRFDGRELVTGAVDNNTGARTGAIPRRKKVYFEIEIIAQGDSSSGTQLGVRKMAEGSNVGDHPAIATDGYHMDGTGGIVDGDEVSIGIFAPLGIPQTGRVFQFAIDWESGDWWVGYDDTLWAGIGAAGDPATGANPLPALDGFYNWAASTLINGSNGNSTVHLLTHLGEFNFTPPTGFESWDEKTAPPAVADNQYSTDVKTDTPLSYWRMEETEGAYIRDDVGGNTAQLLGRFAQNQAAIHNYGGSCQWFGNSGDAAVSAVDASLQLLGDMTMECWIDIDVLTSYRYVMQCGSVGETAQTNVSWSFSIDSSGRIRYLHEYGAGTNEDHTTVAAPISINTAHHIVLVRDDAAKTVAVYVDSVFIENLTYVNSPTGGTENFIILANSSGLTTNEFDGHISDVAIYNFKLAPARITSHYTAGTT